jgi:NTE family protein
VDTAPETERRTVIASRLPVRDWPDRDLRITAVAAGSGDRVVFTSAGAQGPDGSVSAGVELVDAVAASCAVPGVWPPVTIDGHRYIDGGMASIVHVALADEPDPVDRVLVVAPLDPPAGGPFASASEEVARRREALGAEGVLGVLADEPSLAAFGANVLDPAVMPASARAGYAQGQAVAEDVVRLWA